MPQPTPNPEEKKSDIKGALGDSSSVGDGAADKPPREVLIDTEKGSSFWDQRLDSESEVEDITQDLHEQDMQTREVAATTDQGMRTTSSPPEYELSQKHLKKLERWWYSQDESTRHYILNHPATPQLVVDYFREGGEAVTEHNITDFNEVWHRLRQLADQAPNEAANPPNGVDEGNGIATESSSQTEVSDKNLESDSSDGKEKSSKLDSEEEKTHEMVREHLGPVANEVRSMKKRAESNLIQDDYGNYWRMGDIHTGANLSVDLYSLSNSEDQDPVKVPFVDNEGNTFPEKFTAVTKDMSLPGGIDMYDSDPPEVDSTEGVRKLIEQIPEKPTEADKNAVYSQIWEKAKEKGVIELPGYDQGRYVKAVRELEDADNLQYWYYEDIEGNQRKNEPRLESRMYNDFIKPKLEEYYSKKINSNESKSIDTDKLESIDVRKLSEPVEEIITSEKNQDLIHEYISKKRALVAFRNNEKKPNDVSEDIWHKVKSSPNYIREEIKQEEANVGYEMKNLADEVFANAQTEEDFRAFLAMAALSTRKKQKQARTALRDEEYRKSLSRANTIKKKLKQKRKSLNQKIENSQSIGGLQEGLDRINSLLDRLNINPQSAEQMPDPKEISVGEKIEADDGVESEGQQSEAKEQDLDTGGIEVGSKVMFGEGDAGRWKHPKEVVDIAKIKGEPYIKVEGENTTDGYHPAEKFTPKTEENIDIDNALSKKDIHSIITESKTAEMASKQILSNEQIFWPEVDGAERYAVKKGEQWKIYDPELEEVADEKTPEEIKKAALKAVKESEPFQEKISRQKEYISTAKDILGDIKGVYQERERLAEKLPDTDNIHELDKDELSEDQLAALSEIEKIDAIETTIARLGDYTADLEDNNLITEEDRGELQETINWVELIVKNHDLNEDMENEFNSLKEYQQKLKTSKDFS